ncbi:transcriptional regulator with XRE-family HTH domain [Labrenzia sp. EL_195]|nr:transcriptional regulator with XRE-family HTH domain [Labrenzia sp. EL_195]
MTEFNDDASQPDYPVQYSAYWIERLADFRKQLLKNGWPIYPGWGKTGGKGWKNHHFHDAPLPTLEDVDSWADLNHPLSTAPNTFMPCSRVCFFDFDFDTSEDIIQQTYNALRRRFEGVMPVLHGKGYRIKVPFKANGPIETTSATLLIEGGMHDVEIRGNKAGAAAYGVHPDTQRPYSWVTAETPYNTHVDELAYLSQDDVEEFIGELAEMFGGFADLSGKSIKHSGGAGGGGVGNTNKIGYSDDGLVCKGREQYAFKLSRQIVSDAVANGCSVEDLNTEALLNEAEAVFVQTAELGKRWADQKARRAALRERINTAIEYQQNDAKDTAQSDSTTAGMFSWLNLNTSALEEPQSNESLSGVVWQIDDTPANNILQFSFRLPRPESGWPDVLGWHEGKGAIAVKLDHPTTPSALFITLGAGVTNFQNLNDVVVERVGADDAVFARLPGEGRLIVCEGFFASLAAWISSGRNIWMSIHHPVDVADSIPDGSILLLDERPYRWNTLKASDRRNTIKGRLDAFRRAGRKFFHVHPQRERKHDSSTFGDLYLDQSPEAVLERIAFADSAADGTARPLETRSKEEARAELGSQIENWGSDVEAGDAPDTMLLRSDAGAGKTEAFVQTLPTTALNIKTKQDQQNPTGDSNPCIVMAVRNHDDSAEVNERIRKAHGSNVRAETFRGREQKDPATGEDMCQNMDAVNEAWAELRNVETTVCADCKFFEVCGYQKQATKQAEVWQVAHALLNTNSLPKCFGDLRGIVVDEDPTGDWITELTVSLDSLTNPDIPVPLGPYGYALRQLRKRLSDVLVTQPVGPVSYEALFGSFSTDDVHTALNAERARKLGDPNSPGGLNAAVFGVSYSDNRSFKAYEALWLVILDAVNREHGSMGRLTIEMIDGEEAGPTRVLNILQRQGIQDAWLHPHKRQKRTPVLFTDATPTEAVLRDFHPDLIVHDTGRIETPHAKIFQDATRRYSKAMLDPDGGEAAKAVKRQLNRLEVGAKAYETVLVTGGEGLITTNKNIREAMEKELAGLKGRFQFQHLNNVRGKDLYKHVTTHFDIGRTDPGKKVFEQEVGALTGTMPESAQGEGYGISDAIRFTPDGPVIDHNQNFNPDPLVQALHNRTVQSEGIQAMARCRPIDRTADRVASIYAFNDTVYETEVSLIEDTWNPHPVFMSLAKYGLAVTDNATRASECFPDLFKTRDVYRNYEETASFGPEMAEFCGKSQIIPKSGCLGILGIYKTIPKIPKLRLFGIISEGQGRKAFRVIVDTLTHEDPEAIIREKFGSAVSITELKIDPSTGKVITTINQGPLREQTRSLMKARKVSQAALANVLDLKQAKVSKWLSGDQDLKAAPLASLIDWIDGNTVEDLFSSPALTAANENTDEQPAVKATATRRIVVSAGANIVASPKPKPATRRITSKGTATVLMFEWQNAVDTPEWPQLPTEQVNQPPPYVSENHSTAQSGFSHLLSMAISHGGVLLDLNEALTQEEFHLMYGVPE